MADQTTTSAAPAAAGGESSASLLTTPPAASAPPAAAPSAPPVQNSDVKFPENWKQGLPVEFQNDPALKVVNDVPTLVKNYLNAQKLVGAEKLQIPGKHATDEDWRGLFQKLGLPSDVKGYSLKAPDGSQFNPEFVDNFKAAALKANILPKQAENLLGWYAEMRKTEGATQDTKSKTQHAAEMDALKTEWGGAYETKLLAAQVAFKEFGDEASTKFLNESGLGNNPQLLRLFSKIGEVMKEDVVRGGVPRGDASLMDPQEAKNEIKKVLGDTTHPYFDKNHANHAAAVEEMKKLNNMAYPQIKEK